MAKVDCYALEQAAKASLATRYGVTCSLDEYIANMKAGANMSLLLGISGCDGYQEIVDCFMKERDVDPCNQTTIKDCSGLDISFQSPEDKPCYLTISFINV